MNEEKIQRSDSGRGDMDEVKAVKREFRKKRQNYISVIILLAGLLLGSIFVDVAQFFGKSGFSPRVIKEAEILTAGDKTWVAYTDPIIGLKVINDPNCGEVCDASEPIKWMKKVLPTIKSEIITVDSPAGKSMVERYHIKSLPAFVFDENVTKTEVYEQAKEMFTQVDNTYLLNSEQIGIKPGKYLELPKVSDGDNKFGPDDAKVKVVIYSDFACPYCKIFYEQSLRKAMADYKDKVQFVFKHLPLDMHPNAAEAATISECAAQQGKFWEMADKLYAGQKEWASGEKSDVFKNYAAQIGLNMAKFSQCLSEKPSEQKIAEDKAEAESFGISGAPSFFINDQFFNGAINYDEIKKEIDNILGI